MTGSAHGARSRRCSDVLTSIALNSFPFHNFCHSLAFLACLNFMRTMYLLARPVLMSLKWLTSSLAWSPTNPSRSEGIIQDGTARMHKVVHCCGSKSGSSLTCVWPSAAVSCESLYRCTTPQPTSVALGVDGTYAAFVWRPVGGSLVEAGSMSMLSIVTGPYRQSLVAISLEAFLGRMVGEAVSFRATFLSGSKSASL
jgi:hypothetical protein